MGYTHYFHQNRDFADNEWKEICKRTRLILKATDVPLARDYDEVDRKPVVSVKQIWFNGQGDDGHETFWLSKAKPEQWRTDKTEADPYFNFCKTARKPYDAVVVDVLKMINEVAPGALTLGSDGDKCEKNPKTDRWEVTEPLFPPHAPLREYRVMVKRTVECMVTVRAKDRDAAQNIAAARVVQQGEAALKGGKSTVRVGLVSRGSDIKAA